MEKEFDIQSYMTAGVERVVKDSLRATLKDPKESIFMGKFALATKKASDIRKQFEADGLHVPPFQPVPLQPCQYPVSSSQS